MPFLATTHDHASPVDLYYLDSGPKAAQTTVVLIHGWPLSHRMWEGNVAPLLEAGHRVLRYDRRGFGVSGYSWDGHDYDTLTADLHDLLTGLEIDNAVLVGFSMGGGEVARYVENYGLDRIQKVAFVSSVAPYLLRTEENPDGVADKVFREMEADVQADRLHFLKGFGEKFVNYEDHGPDGTEKISAATLEYLWQIAAFASPRATLAQINAFARTDLRPGVRKITCPTLVVHGAADQTVPLEASGERVAEMVPTSRLEVLEDAPHGLTITHRKQFNQLLLDFLAE